MKKTRRDFFKQTSIVAAALAVPQRGVFLAAPSPTAQQNSNSFYKEVCILALDAARGRGASYADVRVVDRRTQYVSVKDRQRDQVSDTTTLGIGVRALVNGKWGFASSTNVTRQEGRTAAERAVQRAEDNGRTPLRPIELAPVDAYPDGVWQSPVRRDPFDVTVDEKVDHLIDAVDSAMTLQSVQSAVAFISLERDAKVFASTDGSVITQVRYRTWPSITVTAATSDSSVTQSRTSNEIVPLGIGYEHVLSANLSERARELAEDAVEGLLARPAEPGVYDLIIDPTNLHLTIHETIGRATELDRALGYAEGGPESSILSSPREAIGQLRFGPEFMNVLGDRTQRGGLATVGWDDEGVPQDSWPIISDGVFMDFQTTRESAPLIAELTGVTRSHGCSAAESWEFSQLQRMPNVSLLPGENDYVIDDLISATDRGILVKGVGANNIDRSRDDYQFGGQAFYEIRGGRIIGQVANVAYRDSMLDFWNSMDMLGGPSSYVLGGVVDDLKGQPQQVHAVSHGCPPARFSQRTVVNVAP